jgi:hypothetical protein
VINVIEAKDRAIGRLAKANILRMCLCLLVGLPAGDRYAVWAQDKEILDNGIVRLLFDQHIGEFEAQSLLSGAVRLVDAGPSFQKDGQTLSAKDATGIEVHREPFEDQIGKGQQLVVQYRFQGGIPSVRYELRLYERKPWVGVTAHLSPGSFQLGDVDVVQGKLLVPEAFGTRIYICSGTAGGDSGVWQLGMRRWESSALSVVYEPRVRAAISLGFYSFYRASSSVVVRYLSANEIGISGVAHYNGYRPQDQELRTESLRLNFDRDPLGSLEAWADAAEKVVQPKFNHDTRTGILNTWFVYGNETSEERELKQTKLLHDSILPDYGIKFVIAGEWQKQRSEPGDTGDSLGFGEDQEDRKLFPHGLEWVCDQIRELGLLPAFGINYAYAAMDSSTAHKNPAWVIRGDLSRLDAGFPIDYTNPDAQKWLFNLAHRAVDLKAGWFWTDFNGGPTRGTLYNPKQIMGFEDVRDGLRTIRKAIGPDVLRDFVCCGQYFTALGLVDRVRTGNDMVAVGDWQGLKDTARQLAALYVGHQRLWITSPDAIFVGGGNAVHDFGAEHIPPDSATLDEVRMRLQLFLSTGSYPTIGENLEDFDSERIHLLTLVLPSYGQAARPLDLFVHTTPEIYDLRVKTGWDRWNVLMLQNWNDYYKKYNVNLSDLGLDESRTYLVFRFWDQVLLGQFRDRVTLNVGARQGETFSIRELPHRPWIISTDMHLTQGGVELQDVSYDEQSGELKGIARRHRGAQGQVVIYVPSGYAIRSASAPYRLEAQPSGAKVVYMALKFSEQTIPWSLSFAESK